MPTRIIRQALVLLGILGLATSGLAQSTTGSFQGTVRDEQNAVVPGATVAVRNVDTNARRTAVTDSQGRWRIPNLPVGNYEIQLDLAGFAAVVRSGLTLALNQDAVVDMTLKAATLTESLTVNADAPLLNTTNAEVGVRFDTTRIAELPIGVPSNVPGGGPRDIFALALSAAGVNVLSAGQSTFATGTNFSVNGMRPRGNNFMIDGQDSNDPSVTGRQQPMNNTDIVQEIRLLTNQFNAEFGRAAGSVMNIITKSGTNAFHGSGFWFANRDALNALSNLDKAAGKTDAPFRKQDQYGATLGGPVVKDRLFFFGSYQRWTNRQLGSGNTLNGAPTEAGRQVLQQVAGTRPQVAALLKFLPAGTGLVKNTTINVGGQNYVVPLGSLTGSADILLNNNQASGRLDYQLSRNHTLSARYLYNEQFTSGDSSQVTPPGYLSVQPTNQHAANAWLTSTLSSKAFNEVRVAFQRLDTQTTASDPASEEIPSIEIAELGLTGFNAATSRTAIGLAVNLPQWRKNNTYQFQENFTYIHGNHSFKVGADVRRISVDSFFQPTIRGRLAYSTLQRFVDDIGDSAAINKPLPGGVTINYYDWWDSYFYAQDEWRLHPTFTLNLGVRYELPGNAVDSLLPVNDEVVAAAGGDERYRLNPVPKKDTNNIQPRVGFNWNPHTGREGLFGFLTGGDRLVIRGGYARTNDYQFLNLALNIASSFPFVAALDLPAVSLPAGGVGVPNAYTRLPNALFPSNPLLVTRTVVSENFRAPVADQWSFELQRQLTENLVARAGYVGTRGKDLFQTLDGNPRLPFSTQRVDPTRGVIRLRDNAAKSVYDSLQVGLEQRVSKGFSAGIYYTYSRFLDDASDTFNPNVNGDVALPQDSFDIGAERGRSTYDRPQRLTGSFVWELPFQRGQQGATGKILGGWQISTSFNFQDGAPFTALNGADPTGAIAGISGLVGNSIRPNLNTTLDLSNMTIDELKDAGGASLFRPLCGNPSATCPGERVGNAGRNILRSDGIFNIDFAIIKNTRIFRDHVLQFRCEMFNLTNTRNFGIPEGRINSANFLNEKGTDGGNRFIWLSVRYRF
jgi:Carboxypeptidase regulatory-like domain